MENISQYEYRRLELNDSILTIDMFKSFSTIPKYNSVSILLQPLLVACTDAKVDPSDNVRSFSSLDLLAIHRYPLICFRGAESLPTNSAPVLYM